MQASNTSPALAIETDTKSRTPVRGLLLAAARFFWTTLAILLIVLFLGGLPFRYIELAHLPWKEVVALKWMGLNSTFYIIFNFALDVVTLLAFVLTGALIFWSKADDWMALLVSVSLIAFPVSVVPVFDALDSHTGALGQSLILLMRGIGLGATLLFFYLFPNGKFVPRWTRVLLIVWVGYIIVWRFFASAPVFVEGSSPIMRFLFNMIASSPNALTQFYESVHFASLLLILLGWFGSGVFAQIYRYKRVSNPVERQQSKWVVLGLTSAFFGYSVYELLPRLMPDLAVPGYAHLVYTLVGQPLFVGSLLLVPLFIGISITLYQLWDIDAIINRTLVYGGLMSLLGALYFGIVIILQRFSTWITGVSNSDFIVAATTLVIATLFQPLRERVQNIIDRRFYREKVDFRKAFTEFSHQVRTIIEMPELMRILVIRTTDLLHIIYGAVYLKTEENSFVLADTHNLPETCCTSLHLDLYTVQRLSAGYPVPLPRDASFLMLVPLMAPLRPTHVQAPAGERPAGPAEKHLAQERLLGILALGPRLSGLNYSREDQTLLMGLADQAGTAIYVAQLVESTQEEARRREEAEDRLDEHRRSPSGRAEEMANLLLAEPATALRQLYNLTQAAGQEPESAGLLANLPNVLKRMDSGPLALLAEGYNYLYFSQFTPELLPAGLRSLLSALSDEEQKTPKIFDSHSRTCALRVYGLCQTALDANSVAQITSLMPDLVETACEATTIGPEKSLAGDAALPAKPFLTDLGKVLQEMHSVAEALRSYERVDTAQDKLAYLASAVERLRHVDRLARTELGSADRSLVQRIIESWLASIAGAMSELQTRARLVCHMLTRHTWQDDIVSLALNLRNDGRGAALNIRVTLAPAPEYSMLEDTVRIERLGPTEETQIHVRVRPHLESGADHFRARFIISYTDPRGPDQVENFADVIRLLATETKFQFVPNPYVVGTPLQTGSPLFFGREDILAFIQENLASTHRNNLVLIGQRRTGKTSLLKQLPARLGDDYLPVYMDGQSLGLDPGLPNFFLALATEISFAMEDRGFEIEPPTHEAFVTSPAATFEKNFLGKVRDAIGSRHLLLMLDEFEELEAAVRRGDLEASIFGFLRHLIQHSNNLSVIFCGTHRLEELAADYWNVLFNISLYKHIGFLEKQEAAHLIQEPVKTYGMLYDDLAIDKIWRVTAGHPYFLQLLCHSLVNRHNKGQRSYVTVADVNAALDEILASGEAHFVYLYTESTPIERLVLTALSRMIPLTGHATPVQVVDYLDERGVTMERQAVSQAMHHLALRGILIETSETQGAIDEVYYWKLGLLGLWVEKYKSWSRVVDEI